MRAYVGHFTEEPFHQFLVLGYNFQDALDAVDMLGQPDESSIRPVHNPFLLRVKLFSVAGQLDFGNAKGNPVPLVSEDLVLLRKNPGTGSTGDTLRSYGDRCEDCGFQHLDNQDCKVFLEGEDDDVVPIRLWVNRKAPGEGLIDIRGDLDPFTVTDQNPDFVEVCNLGDYRLMAVFPFHWHGTMYGESRGLPCVEGDQEELLAECLEAGIKIPKIREEY